MSDVKYRINKYKQYDLVGMSEYFEDMAQQGWLIEKVWGPFFKFKKIEPVKMHFTFVYNENVPCINDIFQKRFSEFCDSVKPKGWEFFTTINNIAVFVNYSENPIPIITDAKLQLDEIHNNYGKMLIVLLITWCAIFFLDISIDEVRKYAYYYPKHLYVLFISAVFIFAAFRDNIIYFKWRGKAKKYAEDYNKIPDVKKGSSLPLALACLLLVFIFSISNVAPVVGLMSIISLLLSFNIYLKREEIKPAVATALILLSGVAFMVTSFNMTVLLDNREVIKTYIFKDESTFNIYNDKLPLTLEDLGMAHCENYSYLNNKYKSLIEEKYTCRQISYADNNIVESLDYTIIKSQSKKILDIVEEFIVSNLMDETNEEIWGANRVWEQGTSYIVRYDDRIIDIYFTDTPTDEQIKLTVQKLKNL